MIRGVMMMGFFLIGFACLVAAILLYLRKEDNTFSRVLSKVSQVVDDYERTKASHAELTNRCVENSIVLNANREAVGKLMDRLQMLEMRLDAQKQPVLNAKFPDKLTVTLSQPVQLEGTQTPIKVIHREMKKKMPTPLLDKAGVTRKVRVRGPNVSQ